MKHIWEHIKTFLLLTIWILMVTVSCNGCLYGVTGDFLLNLPEQESEKDNE